MEKYENNAFQFSTFPARHSLGDGGSIQPLAFPFGGADQLRNAVKNCAPILERNWF
jgi:hypothetical protein